MTCVRSCVLALLVPIAVAAAGGESARTGPAARGGSDDQARRDGVQITNHPGGTVAERAAWRAGVRHGARTTYGVDGALIADELWHDGVLVAPRSVAQIEAFRAEARIRAAKDLTAFTAPAGVAAPGNADLAAALALVRTYRFIAEVPPDVELRADYVELAQRAAETCAALRKLTHRPEPPPGMDPAIYERGRQGCGSSNLAVGVPLVTSIHLYMDDSDQMNLPRLGHRRWLLSPVIAATGFGVHGTFSAMHVFDRGRKAVPDWEVIRHPSRGFQPLALFGARRAWHAQFNARHYRPGPGTAMAIHPVDADFKPGPALKLGHHGVATAMSGDGWAVIARPADPAYRLVADATYQVVVSGLVAAGGKPAELRWFVRFY